IHGKVREKGYSIVPLKFYFKDSLVKVEIALVRGKQNYDKRDSILQKDRDRDQQRAIKEYSERR
ncbi:MAG: SsrA-binding protein, partial [Clostridia bacterium]|nr:SsrA-binding protein [Clostridia bacterium]